MGKYKDLTGQKFGRLTCVKDAGRARSKSVLWLCNCDCGEEVTVVSASLISGNTKSCGCVSSELTAKRNTTHGLSMGENGKETRLYGVWKAMKQRCVNPSSPDYGNYGGRGITVCGEWMDYKNFHDWAETSGYKIGLTIERVDRNGNYEPANCEWIPSEAQAKNRSNNHIISWRGKKKTLTDWSKALGIDASLLRYRLKAWGVDRAFTASVGKKKGEYVCLSNG